MLKLIVDNREHAVIKNLNIDYETAQLSIGDFQFWNDDQLIMVIERKTYADLAASIKDGRYSEQKYRLNELSKTTGCSVVYFIEGKINNNYNIPEATLKSCILSLISKESYEVLQLKNCEETILALKCILMMEHKVSIIEDIEQENVEQVIMQLYKKIKEKSKHASHSCNYNEASLKTKKKTMMNPHNVFVQQLCMVKSVSLTIAECIANSYPNFSSLFNAYEKCENEKSKINLLKNLSYKTDNNLRRKVGPVASKNIYESIYGETICLV
jgi:crossover junction endonuclease MUS81|uniref:ERCC4 domain-containing protein n=1 Tax=viral metagenome TaxID=1070528 RepID=A0A6C0J535_9ZZZZ